jgi:hypothetical protein
MTWRIVKDSLLIGRYSALNARSAAKGRTKIAAFDLVGRIFQLRVQVWSNT